MNNHPAKHLADAGAALLASAALAGWLSPIAAGMSIVWYGIRFKEWWESRKKED
jgi:hypothetical protein